MSDTTSSPRRSINNVGDLQFDVRTMETREQGPVFPRSSSISSTGTKKVGNKNINRKILKRVKWMGRPPGILDEYIRWNETSDYAASNWFDVAIPAGVPAQSGMHPCCD